MFHLPRSGLVLLLPSLALWAADVPAGAADPGKAWFAEARFGMFIHWGIYAIPAGQWKGKAIWGGGEWIQNCGNLPHGEYAALAGQFNPVKFDAQAWTALAKQAGMRYLVVTAKHHDGFAMYPSAVSPFNIQDATPFKRDVVGELSTACTAQGLRFGTYYSQSQDWHHPGGTLYPINGRKSPLERFDPAMDGDFDAYLTKIAVPQVQELLDRYHPAVLWFDTPKEMTLARTAPFIGQIAKHPGMIVNNRLGPGFAGDTMTPEQHIPARGYPGKLFEVCMTMNGTWGFKSDDHDWKSVRQLVRNLSDIASKGGNFLLNVGPTAEGVIPPESVERLQAMGRWMAVNGEAIYATQASPFPRSLPWGRVTQKTDATGTGVTLYLQVWDWPQDGRLTIPRLNQAPDKARLLAGGVPVPAVQQGDAVVLTLPAAAPDADVSVIALHLSAPVVIAEDPLPVPGADGRIVLAVADAEPLGDASGTPQVLGSGAEAALTGWSNPAWTVEYRVKLAKAGSWVVTAEVANPAATKLTLKNGKTVVPCTLGAQAADTWTTATLGTIVLPAGEQILALVPEKKAWTTLRLRSLVLTPAPAP